MTTEGVRYGLWYGFRYNKIHKSLEDIFEVPSLSKFRAFRSSVRFEVPCGHRLIYVFEAVLCQLKDYEFIKF